MKSQKCHLCGSIYKADYTMFRRKIQLAYNPVLYFKVIDSKVHLLGMTNRDGKFECLHCLADKEKK